MSLSLLVSKDAAWETSGEKQWKYLGQPCRNFNILANTVITDPFDGREKFVLSNFASGEVGSIIFIDTQNGKGESFTLPAGAGAWGLVNWHNEKLIIGTCTEKAYLHVFDLKARQFAEPIISIGETYFWQMALASDDKIYGGTYPGCTLTQYDPKTHTFKNLGVVSHNPKNLYSRTVYTDTPGFVFINYGLEQSGVAYYDIQNNKMGDIGQPGDIVKETNKEFICLENDGVFSFYSAKDLSPIEDKDGRLKQQLNRSGSLTPLSGGRLAGVRGQEYYILEKQRELKAEDLKKIPVDAPPTAIFNLVSDKQELIWGACGFGLTIFNFNPKTGKYWNSPTISNSGGEVYGMVFYKEKLFTSAYSGGDHAVYDPSKHWNAFDNINPKTFATVKPKLIRPEGRSVIGPDGGIWTGWSAAYAVYGGGLSRVQPDTLTMQSWYDPVPNQQIAGLTADDKYLYFTTNGGASGLSYNGEVTCHFSVWKPGTGIIKDFVFKKGDFLGLGVLAHSNLVALVVNAEIRIYDPEKENFIRTISLEEKGCRWLIPLDKNHIGAFAGKKLLAININTGTKQIICNLPGDVGAAMISRKGKIYFSVKSKLYTLV